MSRVAKAPIDVPTGVEVSVQGQEVRVNGPKGSLSRVVHEIVEVACDGKPLRCSPRQRTMGAWAQAGTTRALLNNMVTGVSRGFERKLDFVGIGYRAQVQGNVLNMTLGYSHPISFPIPDGITIETPSQSEVLVKGIDRQRVGQTAATIRAFRGPEPYKGKGVKYADEIIVRKEAKKK
jgi:large subunit ribosomal protein L6